MGIFVLYHCVLEGFYLTFIFFKIGVHSEDVALNFKGDMDFRHLNSVVTVKDYGKNSSYIESLLYYEMVMNLWWQGVGDSSLQ